MTAGENSGPSLLRRREVVEALRNGAVPRRGLELFAVGMDRFTKALDEELDAAAGDARVVERLGRVTGYTTGINYFAHSVAETNDDLRALIGAATDFGTPGFLVPLRNTELFRWCLAHGLRVFFVTNMMTIGIYQEPAGAWMPSVGY